MTELLIADPHMTQHPRDADRWNLWAWTKDQVRKYDVDTVIFLGDLTDQKDNHSSVLVNRFVREAHELSKIVKVIFMKGNHDCIDENHPFFQFIGRLKNVVFITRPTEVYNKWLFLPHTKHWEEEWKPYLKNFNDFEMIFCHHTFEGATAENGQTLRGISPLIFKGFKGRIYSGDIHVPQMVGSITYVGSPYKIHFGDRFQPRVLLLQGPKERNLYFTGKGRELLTIQSLSDLQAYDFILGTQVKVRAGLKRSDYPDWANLRKGIVKLCSDRGWELCGIELEQLQSLERIVREEKGTDVIDHVKNHAKRKKLDKPLADLGVELIREVQ